jgi:mevalonate kinase
MILGEYAVLEGHPALVAAIDKYMHVTLKPRTDKKILIHSSLGQYETTIDHLEIVPPFSFVLAALQYHPLSQGCEIDIQAEFSDQLGFSSSASVTVATLAAIMEWQGHDSFSLPFPRRRESIQKNASLQLIDVARSVVQKVQGVGSGADVAACVLGGFVAFYPEPLHAESLTHYPLTVLYSGAKKKTVDVLQIVKNNFLNHPALFQKILHAIGNATQQGIAAVKNKDWSKLGKIMNIHQGLHESLGVSTPLLEQMIQDLRVNSQILGAKISGSGLGDCVIGLGNCQSVTTKNYIPIQISSKGVTCEKI